MYYHSNDSDVNKTLDLLKDLLGNINVNQTVNVNCGSSEGHKDKKDKKDDDDKRKKCECKGFTNGPTIFAEICPDCTIKDSFVFMPDVFGIGSFHSITVDKPECFRVDDTEYLTTSGKGIFDSQVGAYTLILADNPDAGGFVILTFLQLTDSGPIIFALGVQQDVEIEDCRDEKCKKPHKTLPGKLPAPRHCAPFAKKITICPHGGVIEEDLNFKRRKY